MALARALCTGTHTQSVHTGTHHYVHTRAPSCRIRFTEEKTNVLSTGKLYFNINSMLTSLHHYFFHIPTSIHLSTAVSDSSFQTLMWD